MLEILDFTGVAVFGLVDRPIAGLAGMGCIAAIRPGAIAWNWTLPVFGIPGPEDR